MIEKIVLGKFSDKNDIEEKDMSILNKKNEKVILVKNNGNEQICFVDANEQVDLQKNENNLQK